MKKTLSIQVQPDGTYNIIKLESNEIIENVPNVIAAMMLVQSYIESDIKKGSR